MALIRLFGRGKSGKSGGGARSEVGAVDAGDISAALADLTTASLSATWRCRHASGTSLAEGSVNFTERSSQAVVIRGKHTYEYVRRSSSVLRSEVLDEALVVQNAAEEPEAEQGADPEDPDAELDETGLEAAESDEDDGEDADGADAEDEESEPEASAEDDEDADDESEDDGEEEAEDGDDEPAAEADADAESDEDEEGDEEGEGDDEDDDALTAEAETGESGEPGESAEEESKPAAPARPAWNYFSDSDACGPHAYAEPDVLAKAALSSGAVQIAKPEEFNGVLHNAYTVTLKPKPTDSDKALARLARQLRDHGANVIVVTAFTNPDAALDEDDDEDDVDELDLDEGEERGADDDVEEYEDFDDVVAAGGLGRHDDEDDEGRRRGPADPAKRIVRLRIELPHWTPADDPGADHAVRIDLFDLGEPVQIESPGRSNATRRTLRTCADLSLF